jgi:hypothetical protein
MSRLGLGGTILKTVIHSDYRDVLFLGKTSNSGHALNCSQCPCSPMRDKTPTVLETLKDYLLSLMWRRVTRKRALKVNHPSEDIQYS